MLKILNSLAVLSYPFRIFFLACGIYAIFIIAAWLAILLGALNLPLAWTPLYWHSHEMIFGVVTAAICGFLLTAWLICSLVNSKGIISKIPQLNYPQPKIRLRKGVVLRTWSKGHRCAIKSKGRHCVT